MFDAPGEGAACRYVMCFVLPIDNALHDSVGVDIIQYHTAFSGFSALKTITKFANVHDKEQCVGGEGHFFWHNVKDAEKSDLPVTGNANVSRVRK